ncbi:MAG: hypothetical protein WBG86_17880 [Polyangiales bacterium]
MARPKAPERADSPYPTMDEVDKASRIQLGRWQRYLPSPGTSGIGHSGFGDVLATESAVADLIAKRFNEKGGWSPNISKAVDRAEGK